ncbi:signal transduction histidine kinase [Glaciihabitans tibetensis]|uniref:histidine kinase n=1 Tax=Glaciihabitans tibetensis TaxID=1266600 RepID=A0A2T0VJ48_9MICO|nr:histidine kinase [Glaciihabitans tibetensis]PRY70228.1 signal transduction histidine kinase [Glaciihabitans tibetensis]
MFRSLRPYQVAVDCLVAAVFFLVAAVTGDGSGGYTALTVVLTSALLLRRLAPGLALALSWVAAVAQMYAIELAPVVADFAILAVVYSTSAYGGRVVKWLGLASVGLGALLGSVFLTFTSMFLFGPSATDSLATIVLQFFFQLVAMLVLLGLPWTVGLLVRTRIAARESREAERAALAEAELAEREVIVEQERNRIARDMHDVVAHSLAVVIAQSDGARYARAQDPAAVDGALTAISTTAREALADVRLLLSQLRHSQSAGPQPALADLERLLEQMRGSGLTIVDEVRGQSTTLGTGHQLAVYRIVQEALTNVLRHGDVTQPARMLFTWSENYLEVSITSTLLSSPHTGELRIGHGLAGMRERAALVGGSLTAEPRNREFVVTALIPAARAIRA